MAVVLTCATVACDMCPPPTLGKAAAMPRLLFVASLMMRTVHMSSWCGADTTKGLANKCERGLGSHVVDVSAAGRVAAGDGVIRILHDAGAAVGNHDEDALAVVPALDSHESLVSRGVTQPPATLRSLRCCPALARQHTVAPA